MAEHRENVLCELAMLGSAFDLLSSICCSDHPDQCSGSSRWRIQRLSALDQALESDADVLRVWPQIKDLHFKLPEGFRLIPDSVDNLLGPFGTQINRSDGCDIDDWLSNYEFRTTISRIGFSRDDWKLLKIEHAKARMCQLPEAFHHKLLAAEKLHQADSSPAPSGSVSALSDGDFRRGRYFVNDTRASFLREARLTPTETLKHPRLIPLGYHNITVGSVSRVPEPHVLPVRFLKEKFPVIYKKVIGVEAHPSSHRVQMNHLLKFGNHLPWRPAGALLLIMLLILCSVFSGVTEYNCSVDALRPMRSPMRKTDKSSGFDGSYLETVEQMYRNPESGFGTLQSDRAGRGIKRRRFSDVYESLLQLADRLFISMLHTRNIIPSPPALSAGRAAVRERGFGETVGGRLVFNMAKTPALICKGVADLLKKVATHGRSSFGMLGYTIQHGGHAATGRKLNSGEAWIALDLPRCDAQFPSFLTILILTAVGIFMLDAPFIEYSMLLRFAFESSTFTTIIMSTGQVSDLG